jgi:hypothetical protein
VRLSYYLRWARNVCSRSLSLGRMIEAAIKAEFKEQPSNTRLPVLNDREKARCALQRQNTEFSKQIFPEKEYRGLVPNFHIHASVSDLYISTIGLPILLEEI